jgi:UDP-N-acetyl-D-galactosamine dehydrogenase
MGIYVANQVIKLMIKKGHKIEGSKVLVLGITFKENCPDIRNSRVIDVIEELQEFGCDISVSDYWADADEVKKEYNLSLKNDINYNDYDAVILAVAHDKFKDIKLNNDNQIVYDIKSILPHSDGKL